MPERICDKNVLIEFAKALADRGFKPEFDSMTADALVIWLKIGLRRRKPGRIFLWSVVSDQ